MARGPRDTSLFMRSEPCKALLPQTTAQEQHPGRVNVRLCSYAFQIYRCNLGERKKGAVQIIIFPNQRT